MALNVKSFTINGLSLLSGASATKTIDIDSIYCIESEVSQSDILNQPKSYFAALQSSKLRARVTSAGEDPNNPGRSRICISIGLTNAASADVTLKTVVVCAHTVDAGVAGAEGTFFGISDSVGLVVPYSTSIPVQQQIAFSFAFTEESELTVDGDETSYLLESEVGRFVTTHKAGEPDAGETQDIRGRKNFVTSIGVSEIYDISDEHTGIVVDGDILPVDDSQNIGSDESMWGTVHCNNVKTDSLEELSSGGIYLHSDIIPGIADGVVNVVNLGSNTHKLNSMWTKDLYADTVNIHYIRSSVGTAIRQYDSIEPVTTDVSLGSYSKPYGNVWAQNLHGAITIPTPTVSGNPGTTNANIPVGAIVNICLANRDNTDLATNAVVHCGETVSTSGGTLADSNTYTCIYVALNRQLLGGGSDITFDTVSTPLAEGMTFRVLTGCVNNEARKDLVCLAIRTA